MPCTFLPLCFALVVSPWTHCSVFVPPPTSPGDGQCAEAVLQKRWVSHSNEGSLTCFLALLFFPGTGARVVVGLLGGRLSVSCSLPGHLQPSLQPNNLPFQAG